MSKTHVLSCILIIVLILFCFLSCNKRGKLSETIINKIDLICDEKEYCMIDLNELVNFEWERAVFFESSCTSESISKLLGIDFNEIHNLNYGMIFAYQNEIVYKEIFLEPVETPNRFWIRVFDDKKDIGSCVLVTPENAVLYAHRSFYDRENRYYYTAEIGGRSQRIDLME